MHMEDNGNCAYSRKYMADRLRRLGFPELAEKALTELPDQVSVDQLEAWTGQYGVTMDEAISRMGGSP